MREYIIKINENKIESPSITLVQNDYNSTKLVFEFDVEDLYTKVFQMKLPSGSTWIKEITNNELVLADENNSEIVPVLVENGIYEYDIAIYDGNSKLTTTEKARFTVRKKIEGENIELDDRTPILDNLINQTNNLNIEVEKTGSTTIITNTKKDGTTNQSVINDGTDYIITEEDKEEIVNTTKPLVEADLQPIIENIENVARQAENIARGRATGYVFETKEDLQIWLQDIENTSKLVIGDNFYIKELNTPDYWWGGDDFYQLETEKPDLTAYAKKEQFVTLTQEEYDALEEKSANTYYFIIEEE